MTTKNKTVWFCTECGYESVKLMGQCPSCKAWNSMKQAPVAKSAPSLTPAGPGTQNRPVTLSQIDFTLENRVSLGISEVDRILGGGIVPGSLVLIGGEPGIGKSTLSLQIPLSRPDLKTLYVTGEESEKQVKMRAERLKGLNGASLDNCLVYSEISIENIIAHATELKPELLIVDSVQTMMTETVESTPGSVSQIKEVAATLLRFAKQTGIPVILIGHITKDGYIAGPKILEHIVDVVLQFEGDNTGVYRLLRGIKNRFGSSSELAVFEMTGLGLKQVDNPSNMLIPMHDQGLSGAAICASVDGTRPMLFEVQALVSSAVYGTAQRSATGFDTRRLNMLLAVLEKRAGFHLAAKDVFLNMAGGLKVTDTACDMAVIAAVLSSNFDLEIPQNVCFAGEVGLSGEIRPVSQTDRRINEAARLGFKKIFVSSYSSLEGSPKDITIVKVADVPALVKALFK